MDVVFSKDYLLFPGVNCDSESFLIYGGRIAAAILIWPLQLESRTKSKFPRIWTTLMHDRRSSARCMCIKSASYGACLKRMPLSRFYKSWIIERCQNSTACEGFDGLQFHGAWSFLYRYHMDSYSYSQGFRCWRKGRANSWIQIWILRRRHLDP